MSTTRNNNNRKLEKKEPSINARTHLQIQLGDQKTVWFPRSRLNLISEATLWLPMVTNWCFTGVGEIVPFLATFLEKLSRMSGSHTDLIKFVDQLPKDGLEACIQLMFEIKYRFPSDEAKPGSKVEAEWPEYLYEKIELRTDPEVLLKLCRSYDWYLAASRRVVTLTHVSKKGLTKAFLRAVGKIAETNPSLAFVLSPTTLHENTLVAPEIAKFFTCDPLKAQSLDVLSSYRSVLEESKCKGIEMGQVNIMAERPPIQVAADRVQSVMKFMRDGAGQFPWHHPTRPDTGVLLAGGFPCAALLSREKYDQILPKTDLDFFVYSPTDEGQREMGEIILRHVEKIGGKLQQVVMGGDNTEAAAAKILKTACVFQVTGLEREVQIIFPFAFSPLGVLINFDSTFIQVGYHEDINRNGSFVATPGFCFFTPRSESLITRYNIRYYRLMKMLARGFTPVSDERGHLLYPAKAFFSSRWRLGLDGPAKMDETQIKLGAIRAYIIGKGIKHEDLEKRLGADVLKKDADKAYLTLPNEFFEDKEFFERAMNNSRALLAFDESGHCHRVTIWGFDGREEQSKHMCWSGKPDVTWLNVSVEEVLKDFDPQGATLANGFDIYTAGVNNTLPIPGDGETDNLYEFNVLLRNIEILPPQKKYNLAAPEEKPLNVNFVPFPDERMYYRSDIYSQCGTEPVRTIEGVFLFSDFKTEEEVDAEYVEHERRRLIGLEKMQRKGDLRARLKNEREARRIKEEEMKLADYKGKTTDAQRSKELEERLEKLKFREERRLKNRDEHKERLRQEIIKSIEQPKEERDPRRVKMASLVTHINFRDLHRYIATPKEMVCIGVEELPWMMKAFGSGKQEYTTKDNKAVIKRSDGMVKIRATITFNPCMVFDVDDLFLPQRSIDTHAKRRYNAVVKLANLTRWIVKAHEHKGVLTTASSRKLIIAALQSELDGLEKKAGMPVTEFMRAIRHVANEATFEEQSNKLSCSKPHAAKGLPGEMPVLLCSRLYVTRHE